MERGIENKFGTRVLLKITSHTSDFIHGKSDLQESFGVLFISLQSGLLNLNLWRKSRPSCNPLIMWLERFLSSLAGPYVGVMPFEI